MWGKERVTSGEVKPAWRGGEGGQRGRNKGDGGGGMASWMDG